MHYFRRYIITVAFFVILPCVAFSVSAPSLSSFKRFFRDNDTVLRTADVFVIFDKTTDKQLFVELIKTKTEGASSVYELRLLDIVMASDGKPSVLQRHIKGGEVFSIETTLNSNGELNVLGDIRVLAEKLGASQENIAFLPYAQFKDSRTAQHALNTSPSSIPLRKSAYVLPAEKYKAQPFLKDGKATPINLDNVIALRSPEGSSIRFVEFMTIGNYHYFRPLKRDGMQTHLAFLPLDNSLVARFSKNTPVEQAAILLASPPTYTPNGLPYRNGSTLYTAASLDSLALSRSRIDTISAETLTPKRGVLPPEASISNIDIKNVVFVGDASRGDLKIFEVLSVNNEFFVRSLHYDASGDILTLSANSSFSLVNGRVPADTLVYGHTGGKMLWTLEPTKYGAARNAFGESFFSNSDIVVMDLSLLMEDRGKAFLNQKRKDKDLGDLFPRLMATKSIETSASPLLAPVAYTVESWNFNGGGIGAAPVGVAPSAPRLSTAGLGAENVYLEPNTGAANPPPVPLRGGRRNAVVTPIVPGTLEGQPFRAASNPPAPNAAGTPLPRPQRSFHTLGAIDSYLVANTFQIKQVKDTIAGGFNYHVRETASSDVRIYYNKRDFDAWSSQKKRELAKDLVFSDSLPQGDLALLVDDVNHVLLSPEKRAELKTYIANNWEVLQLRDPSLRSNPNFQEALGRHIFPPAAGRGQSRSASGCGVLPTLSASVDGAMGLIATPGVPVLPCGSTNSLQPNRGSRVSPMPNGPQRQSTTPLISGGGSHLGRSAYDNASPAVPTAAGSLNARPSSANAAVAPSRRGSVAEEAAYNAIPAPNTNNGANTIPLPTAGRVAPQPTTVLTADMPLPAIAKPKTSTLKVTAAGLGITAVSAVVATIIGLAVSSAAKKAVSGGTPPDAPVPPATDEERCEAQGGVWDPINETCILSFSVGFSANSSHSATYPITATLIHAPMNISSMQARQTYDLAGHHVYSFQEGEGNTSYGNTFLTSSTAAASYSSLFALHNGHAMRLQAGFTRGLNSDTTSLDDTYISFGYHHSFARHVGMITTLEQYQTTDMLSLRLNDTILQGQQSLNRRDIRSVLYGRVADVSFFAGGSIRNISYDALTHSTAFSLDATTTQETFAVAGFDYGLSFSKEHRFILSTEVSYALHGASDSRNGLMADGSGFVLTHYQNALNAQFSMDYRYQPTTQSLLSLSGSYGTDSGVLFKLTGRYLF